MWPFQFKQKEPKKTQFRVITFNIGFLTLYRAEVKASGWNTFCAYNDGTILWCDGKNEEKNYCFRYIESYRKIKGLRRDEIEITEIDQRTEQVTSEH